VKKLVAKISAEKNRCGQKLKMKSIPQRKKKMYNAAHE
jgi:hypothetical protein